MEEQSTYEVSDAVIIWVIFYNATVKEFSNPIKSHWEKLLQS